jgi:hypothetical protein
LRPAHVILTRAAETQCFGFAARSVRNARHELGHLRESLPIKLVRIAGGTALFLTVGFVPAFPRQPMVGVTCGCGLFVLVALGLLCFLRLTDRLPLRLELQSARLAR